MATLKNSRVLRTIPLLITSARRMGFSPCGHSLRGYVTAVIVSMTILSSAYAQYGGGTGESNDPYLIYTAEQMNEIGLHEEDWIKHFKLMADIDLSSFTGTDFNIIGIDEGNPFTGVFDGNGKRISNFSYTSADRGYVGLFGYVKGENADIKDLGLIEPNVDAGTGDHVGSLAGDMNGGTINNCYAEGANVARHNCVGGLVEYLAEQRP